MGVVRAGELECGKQGPAPFMDNWKFDSGMRLADKLPTGKGPPANNLNSLQWHRGKRGGYPHRHLIAGSDSQPARCLPCVTDVTFREVTAIRVSSDPHLTILPPCSPVPVGEQVSVSPPLYPQSPSARNNLYLASYGPKSPSARKCHYLKSLHRNDPIGPEKTAPATDADRGSNAVSQNRVGLASTAKSLRSRQISCIPCFNVVLTLLLSCTFDSPAAADLPRPRNKKAESKPKTGNGMSEASSF